MEKLKKGLLWYGAVIAALSGAIILGRLLGQCLPAPPRSSERSSALDRPIDVYVDAGAADETNTCDKIRQLVKDNYLWQPPNQDALDCIDGEERLVESLGDPHSRHLSIEEAKNILECVPLTFLEMKPGKIAYIKLINFCPGAAAGLDWAAKIAKKKKAKGIILDLRGNLGGSLSEAVDITSQWIKKGIIVTERNEKDPPTKILLKSNNKPHRLAGMDTIILVDGRTASASEIVAGVLQEYGLATLVGQKTYGKGTIQKLFLLDDGSYLKLTTDKWYTPAGRNIDGKGLEPDVPVEDADKKRENKEGDWELFISLEMFR